MKRIALVVLVGMICFAALGLAQNAQPAASGKHKIVMQMNVAGDESWGQLFNNVANLQKSFGKDAQIEVVFYGKGITALLKTNMAYEERMKKAVEAGVVLAACQNSMRARNIKSEDIFSFSKEVDSGVAELVRKQEEGFSYIRAGE